MNNIKKMFKDRCDQLLQLSGFSRNRNTYYRIVNDVYQSFILKLYQSAPICTVEFDICPLCMPLDPMIVRYPAMYDLSASCLSTVGGWYYAKDDENKEQCIEKIVGLVETYLMPFFQRANSCLTAFNELIALYKHNEEIRLIYLQQNGMRDRARPLEERILAFREKRYMAIKNRNYEFAIKSFQKSLANLQDALLYIDTITEEETKAKQIDETTHEIQNVTDWIQILKERDEAQIQDRILQQEELSRKIIAKTMK